MATLTSIDRAALTRDVSYESIVSTKSDSSTWDRDLITTNTDTAPTSVWPSSKNSPVLKGAEGPVAKTVSFDDLDTVLLPIIRNVCFVGAGFVGEPLSCSPLPLNPT